MNSSAKFALSFLISASCLALFACSSAPKNSAAVPTPTPPPSSGLVAEPSPKVAAAANHGPARAQLNKDLSKILFAWARQDFKLKADPKKVSTYDLSCTLSVVMPKTGDGDGTTTTHCDYEISVAGHARKKASHKGDEAEKMRDLLLAFPISQGESGAATSFLACDRWSDQTSCDIAIQVDYEGP